MSLLEITYVLADIALVVYVIGQLKGWFLK